MVLSADASPSIGDVSFLLVLLTETVYISSILASALLRSTIPERESSKLRRTRGFDTPSFLDRSLSEISSKPDIVKVEISSPSESEP